MPYLTIKQAKVYYYQNDELRTDKPTIVFVHGAGGSGDNWRYQLKKIKGYNLIALDLPGHGNSEGEAEDTIEGYCNFVKLFTQALGLKRFVLAGHSMGGAISLEFALACKDLLSGLIVVGSGARLRVNPLILDKLSKGEHPLEFVKYYYSNKVSPKTIELSQEQMKTVSTEVLLRDFKACDKFNLQERLNEINIPVLIICGEEDRMTPVKYSQFLDEKIQQSELVLIQDAGHMAMLEQEDQVNKAIQEFIR